MNRFIKLSVITFLLCITASVSAQNRLFKDQDPVPADFGKEKTVVIVINSEQKKVNKALEDAFEKHYKGEYVIIEPADLSKTIYSDKAKYRYIFRTIIGFSAASGMGNTRMPASNTYTYSVKDRLNNTTNGLDYVGAAYKGLMVAYVKKLEEFRLKNATP